MGTPRDFKRFIAEQEETAAVHEQATGRDRTIIRASVVGILANVLLAALKAVIGLVTHSIAIVMDAVNNLSDAASSIITIVGTKLAGKEPDREHPFGHGRIEYLTALIIAVIILYAGLTSLVESVKKILAPDVPSYDAISLAIVAVGVLVKIVLGSYVKGVGERVNSGSLVNSGADALLDSIISTSTLVAALVFIASGVQLEAWLATVISLIILKSGFDMMSETLSKVLGERADAELIQGIKRTVQSFPDVSGVYDLVLNDYGPDSYNGSVHIEVPDTYSANELDELIRAITIEVYRRHRVILNAVGVYSVNTSDDHAARLRDQVSELVLAHEHVLQMHGFYVDEEAKTMRFDVVVGFDAPDRVAVFKDVRREVERRYPDYRLTAALDTDFAES